MDATHPLFESIGVPRNIGVNHVPAELEVDAFTSRFSCNENLGVLAELLLGIDSGAGCISVTNLHPAVNGGYV